MAGNLKVLSFNIWGLRILAKDLDVRMHAIGDKLANEDYDIVALQEVWSIHYYEIIREKVKNVLPHAHYFHSGVIGSGCATFSKYPIIDTFFQQYLHNGYFWDIFAGDWYAGKGVGCCLIKHPEKCLYVFNTHLHAEYFDHQTPVIEEARTVQCYQLAQFIRRTTRPGDAVLLCGDLNHQPDTLGFKTLLEITKLNDTFEISSTKLNDCFTLDPPFNKYGNQTEPVSRIDYILSSDVLACTTCDLAMQKIPDTDIHYSDHEGYTVTLNLSKKFNENEFVEHTDSPAMQDLLRKLLDVLTTGEKVSDEIHWRKVYFLLIIFFMLIVLPLISIDMFHSIFPGNTTWMGKFVFVLQAFCVVFCVIYFWVNVLIRKADVKIFQHVSSEIKVKLLSLQNMDSKKYD